ncbi:hypothetical protein Moror_11977 [Moniliophthora roreri MCA 2997]|uniref:MYND-type domain-containing protein n=2 Tax=Moniliophthora roreri TaxID=221103 RepID=V2WZL1_MONRO|nr:hypothetical protein Moror_11977 [Moniliophthora roreri MCA 2997]KAI3599072.1 hypothetical protein WG66_004055 [Moniliophthora roreri]
MSDYEDYEKKFREFEASREARKNRPSNTRDTRLESMSSAFKDVPFTTPEGLWAGLSQPDLSFDPSYPCPEAQKALESIATLSAICCIDESCLGCFSGHWPNIVGWLSLILRRSLLDGSPTTAEGLHMQQLAIFIAIAVVSIPGLTDLCDEPSYTESELGSNEEEEDGDDEENEEEDEGEYDEEYIPDTEHIRSFIRLAFEVSVHLAATSNLSFEMIWSKTSSLLSSQTARDEFEAVVGNIPSRFGYDAKQLCFNSIRSLSMAPSIDPWTLRGVLNLMNAFAHCSTDIYRGLLAMDVVKLLTRTLSRISSPRNIISIEEGDIRMTCECVTEICEYLMDLFHDGHTWVVQALDGHVLHHIVEISISRRLNELKVPPSDLSDMRETSRGLVLAIKPFLVFRSVINRVLKEVRTLLEYGYIWRLSKVDQQLEKELLSLYDEAALLKNAMHILDSSGELHPCLNPNCTGVDSGALKRCSACLAAIYCSVKCQKEHWEVEHREHCWEERPQPGHSARLSSLDEGLIRNIVASHVKSMQVNCSIPMIAELDFRDWPTTVGCAPFDELMRKVEDGVVKMEKNVQERLLMENRNVKLGREILFHVIIPGNKRFIYREELASE